MTQEFGAKNRKMELPHGNKSWLTSLWLSFLIGQMGKSIKMIRLWKINELLQANAENCSWCIKSKCQLLFSWFWSSPCFIPAENLSTSWWDRVSFICLWPLSSPPKCKLHEAKNLTCKFISIYSGVSTFTYAWWILMSRSMKEFIAQPGFPMTSLLDLCSVHLVRSCLSSMCS